MRISRCTAVVIATALFSASAQAQVCPASGCQSRGQAHYYAAQTATSFTATPDMCGIVVPLTGSAAQTVTMPATLPNGCTIEFEQDTATAGYIVPGSGLTMPAALAPAIGMYTAGAGTAGSFRIFGTEILAN